MRFEALLARFGVESRGLLQRGACLVVAPELEQRRADAVQNEAFMNAVLTLSTEPERHLIVPESFGVVAVFPPQKPKRIAQRSLALPIARRDRASESAFVDADRSPTHSPLARAARNSLERDGF